MCVQARLMHLKSKVMREIDRLASRQKQAELSAALQRNKLLEFNLQAQIGTLTLGGLAVVSGSWGMNLASGVEEVPGLFYAVCGSMVCAGVSFQARHYLIFNFLYLVLIISI